MKLVYIYDTPLSFHVTLIWKILVFNDIIHSPALRTFPCGIEGSLFNMVDSRIIRLVVSADGLESLLPEVF